MLGRKLQKILEDCLTQLQSGEATIEDCLANHPKYADKLRPLLITSQRIEEGRSVRPSAAFKARTRAQLLSHMKAHPRAKPKKWQWHHLFPFRFRFAFGQALSLSLQATAFTLFALITVTVLAQQALPGDTLYSWKIGSERLLRIIHPNPLSVDLLVAERRTQDLTQVAGTPEAEKAAREGFQQTLKQLSKYTAPLDQKTISIALSQQKVGLEEAQVGVPPELDQLLKLPYDQQPHIQLDSEATIIGSGQIQYNLTLTNTLSSDQPLTVTLASRYSPQAKLLNISERDCNSPINGVITCTVGTLLSDVPRKFSLTTEVDSCFAGSLTNKISISGTNTSLKIADPIEFSNYIPAPYPREARVATVQSFGDVHELGLIKSDSTPIKYNLHVKAAAPTWSPDGTKLAFFGEEGISELGGIYSQGTGIWVMDIVEGQGKNPRQLMAQDHVKSLSWSPDGKNLAVEIGLPKLSHEILIINALDGTLISQFHGEQPTWSPDGQKLMIKGCHPECGLWELNIDGSGGKQITDNSTDSHPDWSPTGEEIVFTSQQRDGNWEIYRLHLASKKLTRLTDRSATDTTPVFGPCGQEIYLRTDHYGSWWITVMKLDGSEERKIHEGIGESNEWGLARPALHWNP